MAPSFLRTRGPQMDPQFMSPDPDQAKPRHVSLAHTPNPPNIHVRRTPPKPSILFRDSLPCSSPTSFHSAPAFSSTRSLTRSFAFTSHSQSPKAKGNRVCGSRPATTLAGCTCSESSIRTLCESLRRCSWMELSAADAPADQTLQQMRPRRQGGFQSLLDPEVIAFRGWEIGAVLGERRGSMASFALEDFVGNGVLLDQIGSLAADGWADVPTLKVMCKEDMDVLGLNQRQRNALELRTYLHDRSLMNYANTLESSGHTLTELLSTSPTQLTSQYRMRRGHVARFLDMGSVCSIKVPSDLVLPARQVTAAHRGGGDLRDFNESSPLFQTQDSEEASRPNTDTPIRNVNNFYGNDEYKAPVLVNGLYGGPTPAVPSRGIFSAPAAEPRLCGFVKSKAMNEEVTPLSVLEKIMVRKLTPEHRMGNNPFQQGTPKTPLPAPTKVSDLWAAKPTLLLCLRRPGCVMCRAEAHQLYTRKPIFDAMGIQLVVCLNDHIESELKAFWPRYWGGMVIVDEQRGFFKALGQGKVRRENYLTGFFLNPASLANFKRASSTGMAWNANGHGTIKGGLYIIRAGSGGVAYQFVERNFGDWAPLEEVLQACADITQRQGVLR